MIGREFDSLENVIRWIQAVSLRICKHIIERVFNELIDRVERGISHEGFYFPEESKMADLVWFIYDGG
jgi:hypothetical protein